MLLIATSASAPARSERASQTGWWWTPEWAAQRASVRAFGGYYWNIGCAGVGPRRYLSKRASAVGPGGALVGQGLKPPPAWKFRRFRCLRVRRGGWTAFELYTLNGGIGFGFVVAPPRGTSYEVTETVTYGE